MTIEYKKNDDVVVVDANLASFGRTEKVTRVVTGGVYATDVKGEEHFYELSSVLPGTNLPFSQRPFEQIVLKEIEKRIPRVLGSFKADNEIRMFGSILRLSLIPEWRLELVVDSLREFAMRLPPRGVTGMTHGYLERLADELENGFKWSGSA